MWMSFAFMYEHLGELFIRGKKRSNLPPFHNGGLHVLSIACPLHSLRSVIIFTFFLQEGLENYWALFWTLT